MRSMFMTVLTAAIVAVLASPAFAQPKHIYLTQDGGSLVSNLWVDNNPGVDGPENELGGDIFEGVRSFSEQMGGIPGFGPQNAGQSIHPGLFGDIEGVTIGVRVTDALRVWDGSDFDEISGDDAGETRMQLAGFTTPFGNNPMSPDTFITPTAAGQTINLDSTWLTAGDEIDEHIQFTLADTSGAILDETAANAVSDIFLVRIEFTSTTLDSTGDIYIALGQNVSDSELAAAQSYVDNVIIPAPGVLPVFAGLALVGARRRRA